MIAHILLVTAIVSMIVISGHQTHFCHFTLLKSISTCSVIFIGSNS